MCDTLCVRGSGRMLFAKNSDRPAGELQVVEGRGARRADAAGRGAGSRIAAPELHTTYLTLTGADAAPDAAPTLLSRPVWMWGAEHGVNAHRVAIGNETIWTIDDPHTEPAGLIGMDLVRLGLERAATASAAVDVITTLLERYGQGGTGEQGHDEPYFSSFLVADPTEAWVLETSGRAWVAQPTSTGCAISNRVTVGTGWSRASADIPPGADFQAWRDPAVPVAIADHRLAVTRALIGIGADGRDDAEAAKHDAYAHGVALTHPDPRAVVATLRHHGTRPWGAPGRGDAPEPPPSDVYDDFSGVTVCMHVRGYQVATASMIAELPEDPAEPARAWAALGSPCVSVFVPVLPPDAGAPAVMPPTLGEERTAARWAALRDRVEVDAGALGPIRAVLDPLEAELWDEADDAAAHGGRDALAAVAVRAGPRLDDALTRLGV